MRSLCAVFAHPDDETFSMGRTLARYADAGVACHLFCATDGDAGRDSGLGTTSRDELGRRRRAELAAAARVLGIRSVHAAGHPDGTLPNVDADLLTGEIVRFLRLHRPQVVVTFGPEGAPNTHRDHRALSRAATAAHFLAGLSTAFPAQRSEGAEPHQPARLYYVSWPRPTPGAPIQVEAVPATARVHVPGQAER
ncbi:MAG TPA: PIG-L family deacetylase, partial [Gemmatimonadaceae bacterium]|nr:PIG-L family deacetylase [Gemmatimonadaceae bacterium]